MTMEIIEKKYCCEHLIALQEKTKSAIIDGYHYKSLKELTDAIRAVFVHAKRDYKCKECNNLVSQFKLNILLTEDTVTAAQNANNVPEVLRVSALVLKNRSEKQKTEQTEILTTWSAT